MATVQKVQSYLSYWFQLGKPIVFEKSQAECLPHPIFQESAFSRSFQECWQRALADPHNCYLRGTNESMADLLSDEWEIVGCARCPMPLPIPVRGIKVSPCPCADLSLWPNSEVPEPRAGVCTSSRLENIRQRLDDHTEEDRLRLQSAYQHSPELPKKVLETFETGLSKKQLGQETPDAR